jgi:hypothetical protein
VLQGAVSFCGATYMFLLPRNTPHSMRPENLYRKGRSSCFQKTGVWQILIPPKQHTCFYCHATRLTACVQKICIEKVAQAASKQRGCGSPTRNTYTYPNASPNSRRSRRQTRIQVAVKANPLTSLAHAARKLNHPKRNIKTMPRNINVQKMRSTC